MTVAIAHYIAILLYLGAAALAATPIARPVRAPLRAVLLILGAGVAAHLFAFLHAWSTSGQLPVVGLGPALSFAGLFMAVTLLFVEIIAKDISLTMIAAPLAALVTSVANISGVLGAPVAANTSGLLEAHITLSFLGLASFATAAAAGTMYLIERRELKSRRLAAMLRAFPPLQTLDRVNNVASLVAWVALTMGVALAFVYVIDAAAPSTAKLLWAIAAWAAVTFAVVARLLLRWGAHSSAIFSGIAFSSIVALYILVRLGVTQGGVFL